MQVAVVVVGGFPIGQVALAVRAAAALAVVAAVHITELLDHRTLVAVAALDRLVVQLQVTVDQESW